MYLNAYDNNTNSLIPYEDIIKQLEISDHLSNLPAISQVEHPVLGVPFYQLHPCETSNLMKDVFHSTSTSPQSIENDYLLSWLTIVGPLVGIQTPLQVLSQTNYNNKQQTSTQ
ncbi:autophagy protein 10 [Tieghemostelium lacteum]|uniref:Ubiquitin-like-conjugating enzyme ATG10 n=1 Tax=Tieghemostelium lacteum TaxID=361077 RepID=A0A151ZGB3_TIELA|nr:autophagy protein 10 [Tieghemostelium lacteum]|eukprot:KYQ93011.1 autophagy protein 10 [Tieghemostelium lacteum]